MATKITLTISDEQLARIKKRIARWKGRTVADYIQRAIAKTLQNAEMFDATLQQDFMETGGPPTPKERAWARRMLTKKRGTRRRAA
jgi:hypothetical protein